MLDLGKCITYVGCITANKGASLMATTKPRLTITLEPSHHAVVSELAALRGVSKSTVVTEMLGASIPALERVTKLLRALEEARSGGYVEEFAANLEEAERTLAPMLVAALEQIDLPLAKSQSPRTCNTGVTTGTKSISEGPSRTEGDTEAASPSKVKSRTKRGC